MISYTYSPLITKPKSQIVAFKIKRVHIKYIGNVIYVKLIYIIAGIARWYQLCQRNTLNEIVEYIYICIYIYMYIYSYQVSTYFGNSSKLFVLAYTCILHGWRMLFTANVLSAKSILASTHTATLDTENEAGALPAYQPQCIEYEWQSRELPFQ